jgi:hypothetical protein
MLFLLLKHFPSRQRFDHEGRSPIVIRKSFSSAAEPPVNPDLRGIGLSLHRGPAATRLARCRMLSQAVGGGKRPGPGDRRRRA